MKKINEFLLSDKLFLGAIVFFAAYFVVGILLVLK